MEKKLKKMQYLGVRLYVTHLVNSAMWREMIKKLFKQRTKKEVVEEQNTSIIQEVIEEDVGYDICKCEKTIFEDVYFSEEFQVIQEELRKTASEFKDLFYNYEFVCAYLNNDRKKIISIIAERYKNGLLSNEVLVEIINSSLLNFSKEEKEGLSSLIDTYNPGSKFPKHS